MTNQSSDTQPALRPLNVLVRGGRLTKFKGQVASIAPGLSVVATAAAVLAGAADQAAAQACGAVVNGQVICDAGDSTANGITYNASGTDDFSLILDDPAMEVGGSGVKVNGASGSTGEIFMHLKDGEVATSTDFIRGIWGTTQGRGGVTVQMDDGRVDTTGEFGTGLWAEIANNSIDDATKNEATATAVMTGGVINTNNDSGHALLADHKGLGAAEALVSGGKITTSRVASRGVWANVSHAQSTGRALASVTGGAEITTSEASSIGVYANNGGLGEATAYLQDSTVTTLGNGSHGLDVATSSDSTAGASAIVLRGNVTTHGRIAKGLSVFTGSLGAATVHLEDGTVTTLGYEGEGLWAEIVNGDNTAKAEARVINGTVLTKGEKANALFATHQGSGDSIVRALGNTTITTEGEASHGLAASGYGANKGIVELGAGAVVRVYGEGAVGLHAEGGTGFDVDVAGEVTGGAGEGAAIRAFFLGSPPSDASGTIDIASTGKVTAGSSGYAIQVNGTGAAVINSAGTITGDIRLGAGNDILTLTGGSVTGDVYSDEGNNTFSLERGRFTGDIRFGAGNDILNLTGGSFTGDIYAGAGDDTVTISAATKYDSSYILDGGAGGDDRLTLSGQTLTATDRLRNWERITLNEDTKLSLDGSVTLETDLALDSATLATTVDRDGNADRLTATGTVTIGEEASVHVTAGNGTDNGSTYAPATTYEILTAGDGITGTFGSVTDTFAFLDATLGYDTNSVTLTLTRNEYGFADVAATQNQTEVANGISTLKSDHEIYKAVIGLSEADSQAAFDNLSGEIHASAGSFLIQNHRIGRDAVVNRLRGAFEGIAAGPVPAAALQGEGPKTGSPMIWGQGYGSWGAISETDTLAALDYFTGGFFAGLDAETPGGWRAGLLGGYGNSSFTVDDRSSSGDANSLTLGAYAGRQLGAFGFRFGGGNAWHDISTSRDVTIDGFGDTLSADYTASTSQAFGEVGYTHDAGFARFEPFTGLALVNQGTDDFTEEGGSAALSVSSSSQTLGMFTFGTRIERQLGKLGEDNVLLTASAGWRHAFGDVDPVTTMRLDGGGTFTVTGVPVDQNAALLEAGLKAHAVDGVFLSAGYNGELGTSVQNHGFNARLSARF